MMAQSPRVTLVLGGARSGKSRYAETQAADWPGERIYIATAEARDDEMRARIAAHRDRRGADWTTLEAPRDLPAVLGEAMSRDTVVLVDCLTLWLSNLLLDEADTDAGLAELVRVLESPKGRVLLVSNEVGLSVVPDNALARAFRDLTGAANQRVAEVAHEVVFVAAGLPLILKPSPR